MSHFKDLRMVPWTPTFQWVSSVEEAAEKINLPHEDYPKRVVWTRNAITSMLPTYPYSLTASASLLVLHRYIFADTSHAGSWRKVAVRVGNHHPPHSDLLPSLMRQLEHYYEEITDLPTLMDWYNDFETIHPFQDGNGRVGGVVVARLSHTLDEEKGYLAPDQ